MRVGCQAEQQLQSVDAASHALHIHVGSTSHSAGAAKHLGHNTSERGSNTQRLEQCCSHTCKYVCVCMLPARACGSCCISSSVEAPACLGTRTDSSPHPSILPGSDVLPWGVCLWATHCSCADAVVSCCCQDFAAKLFELGVPA